MEIKHGTVTGYDQHKRTDNQPCIECKTALKNHWVSTRASKGEHINTLRREWYSRNRSVQARTAVNNEIRSPRADKTKLSVVLTRLTQLIPKLFARK